MAPALALLEFASIADGIAAGDAMVKRAAVEMLRAGTVHPGRFLVLVYGDVAAVEEAVDAGCASCPASLLGVTMLPGVHHQVVDALRGRRRAGGEALGIVETTAVAPIVQAADAGVKEAAVTLRELRLADDLGGKGYLLLGGTITEVQAGLDAALGALSGALPTPQWRIIGQLHPEMDAELTTDPRFHRHLTGTGSTGPTAPTTDTEEH